MGVADLVDADAEGQSVRGGQRAGRARMGDRLPTERAQVEGDAHGFEGRGGTAATERGEVDDNEAGGQGEGSVEDIVAALDQWRAPGKPGREGDGERPGRVGCGRAAAAPGVELVPMLVDEGDRGEGGQAAHARREGWPTTMVLHVGGGAIDKHAVDGEGRGRLVRSWRAGEAGGDQGLLIGDTGVEGDTGREGMRRQGHARGNGGKDEQEGGAMEGGAEARKAGSRGRHGPTIHHPSRRGNRWQASRPLRPPPCKASR